MPNFLAAATHLFAYELYMCQLKEKKVRRLVIQISILDNQLSHRLLTIHLSCGLLYHHHPLIYTFVRTLYFALLRLYIVGNVLQDPEQL